MKEKVHPIILITGASSGIGLAMTDRLAKEGGSPNFRILAMRCYIAFKEGL